MSQNNKAYDPTKKMLGKDKLSRIPVKIEQLDEPLPKPDWLRIRLSHSDRVEELKGKLREKKLFTVCEEASCPNLNECFGKGTATFMIMGDKCTRRCSFCDVGHGRPDPLDENEPKHLGETVAAMGLKYVVITSVDRDDLRDGGAAHFTQCIQAVRDGSPNIQIEVLVPDFRGRMEKALNAMEPCLPDVFNHNIETVPRLYKQARPGSDYQWSLDLLRNFQQRFPGIPTKSGIMVGLGETNEEIRQVLRDLREHGVNMVTMGQYLQPTSYHMPVLRYMPPEEFLELGDYAKSIGFSHVASGPLVRSSYHADKQAAGEDVS
jgi:lipoic acid synthetase